MASVLGNQFLQFPGLGDNWLLRGTVLTDASGNPTNTNVSGGVVDQDGDTLWIPPEILSVSLVANSTGTYEILLQQPWYKIRSLQATSLSPSPQGTQVGTVNVNALTLSTLNTQTLTIKSTAGSSYLTTFTTPANVAAIATQINAGAGAASSTAFADIVTNAAGASFLRLRDKVGGTGSSIQVVSGTAAATLGLTVQTNTGTVLGTMSVQSVNPKGSIVNFQDAQSAFLVHSVSGASANLFSAGFMFEMIISNMNVGKA